MNDAVSTFDLSATLGLKDVSADVRQEINIQFAKNILIRSLYVIATQLSKEQQEQLIDAIEKNDLPAAFGIAQSVPDIDALLKGEAEEQVRQTLEFFKPLLKDT